jgi:hypothetical protein
LRKRAEQRRQEQEATTPTADGGSTPRKVESKKNYESDLLDKIITSDAETIKSWAHAKASEPG